MREIEILAKNQEEAISRVAEAEEVPAENLEVIEEYEPDDVDLKQYQEEQKLDEPPKPDEVTLYVVRVSFDYYVRRAQEWTQGLIERFAPGSKAEAVRFRNTIIVRLDVPETSILIGKKGATLDSLQHVVVRALIVEDEDFPDVMLDVEGYREKKLTRLEREGRRAAEKALRTGRRVPLAPMSPSERKFVHKVLQDFGNVKTESRGTDRSRHIVVEPLNPVRGGQRQGGPRRDGNKGQGGGNRGGGGGNRHGNHDRHPQAEKLAGKGPNKGLGISDEQRRRLYGDLKDEDNNDYNFASGSLLPAFNLDDDDDDTPMEKDDKLVDEIE